MARANALHDKQADPLADPVLSLWTAVVAQALADAEGGARLDRGQARLFLRGGTSFGLRNGRRLRAVDVVLSTIGVDIDVYYALWLPRLERQWAAGESYLAEIAALRQANQLDRRHLYALRAKARAAAIAA